MLPIRSRWIFKIFFLRYIQLRKRDTSPVVNLNQWLNGFSNDPITKAQIWCEIFPKTTKESKFEIERGNFPNEVQEKNLKHVRQGSGENG